MTTNVRRINREISFHLRVFVYVVIFTNSKVIQLKTPLMTCHILQRTWNLHGGKECCPEWGWDLCWWWHSCWSHNPPTYLPWKKFSPKIAGNGPSLMKFKIMVEEKINTTYVKLHSVINLTRRSPTIISMNTVEIHNSRRSGRDTQWRSIVHRRNRHPYSQGRGTFPLSNPSRPTIKYWELQQQFY